MKKIYFLICVLLFGAIDLFAQNTNVTTTNIYTLKAFDGPLTNPHKGFTVPTEGTWIFDPAVEYGPYGEWHNQAWNLIAYGSGYQKWSDLHKGQGVYDWTNLDELLEALAEHNMGYALRVFPYTTSFIRNNSTPTENYDWTPKYVYELGAKNIRATVKGNSLLVSGTQAQVPVWDDPIYLQAAKEFATALAEKYDGDPRIEYIDIRTFGEWGEWHVSNLVGSQMPSLEIQKEIVSHYASVFKKTQLVVTSDAYGDIYTYALSLGITKRDDGLIGIPGTADSLVRAYNANLPTIAENMGQYSIMLEYTDVIPGNYLKWTPQRWVDAIKTAHLTYYVLDQDDYCAYQFYLDNKELADSMTHVIGYNFKITNAELVSTATTNTLNLTVKNTGVAPCFFDVYMVAEFVDNSGSVLSKIGETISIPKKTFKDEMTKDFSFTYNVPNGQTNIATQASVSVALSLYESEEAYFAGKNPTVRFDNDGLLPNNKLLLPTCSHEYGEWNTTKVATTTETGLRKRVCTHENCQSYQEEIIPVLSIENHAKTATTTYEMKPFDGPLANPHKGFTVPIEGLWAFVPEFDYGPYGSLNNRAWDLVTYGSGYQQWNKLNPEKDVYNWTDLDKLLDACAEHGMTYALRVLPYTPSFISGNDTPVEKYDWTPPFVYELGAQKITATLQGKGYQAQVPVWDDPVYLQAAKDFATALAEKYDGDPRIEYIDIRAFGEWGEWHASHLDGSEMPSAEVEIDMLNHYASVFKKTLLVLPSSGSGSVYAHALDLGITKRDDGFIGTPGRPETLIPAYEANLPTIAENIAGYATMLTYTDVIPGNYLKWTPQRWIDAIKTAHLTYYVLDQDSDEGYKFYSENKTLADSMSHVIGYNFRVTDAELLTVTDNTSTMNTLNLTVKNTGVAPCFFDVYMVAEFVDNSGAVLSQFGETISIPKKTFKDEMTKDFSFTYNVPNGQTNIATQAGVAVALSLYESEEAYLAGKNPTVRFDNDGLLPNNKLLLPTCSHEYGEWDTTKVATATETGLRKRVCTHENCKSYEEEIIPALENEEKTQTIQLKKGWNLLSINVHPSDSSIATLFSRIQVGMVKDNDGFWKKSKEDELQSLMNITTGKGYLVYMNEDGSLSVSGKPMTNTTIPKQSGWNLIGTPFQTETPIESVFDANNCEMLINFDGKWQPAGTNNSLQNLKPGEAYFVK